MIRHVKALGILNIVWGSLGILGALVVFFVFGGVIGLVGLNAHRDPDAASIAVPILGMIGGLIVLVILITSLPSIIAGAGLLRVAGWARIFGIIVSALHLLSIPFGTALGIYGLWVLLSSETEALFSPSRPTRIV